MNENELLSEEIEEKYKINEILKEHNELCFISKVSIFMGCIKEMMNDQCNTAKQREYFIEALCLYFKQILED